MALRDRIHLEAYLAASNSLCELLDFPEWDDDRGCAADIPDLVACWRVYPITHNPIFPPLWQLRAHRTFLPDQLRCQIHEWKGWLKQVSSGDQEGYLRELHAYVTSNSMRDHWSELRGTAVASLNQTEAWASQSDLTDVRERILRFPEPMIVETRIDPGEEEAADPNAFNLRYMYLFERVKDLLNLSREWDSRVPEGWQQGNYEASYHLTMENFRDNANDP